MDYSKQYYRRQRTELIRHIPPGKNRILDVGCAEGLIGENLKQQGLANEVIGIELSSDAARAAEARLDRVICGDLESMDLMQLGLQKQSFDFVLCADILEHLCDPWKEIGILTNLLKNKGMLIVSIPNVRHWSVVFPLLFKGEWQYQSQGILDRTHLRFFTRKTAIALVADAGLNIVSCKPLIYRKIDKTLTKISFGALDGLCSLQWLIVAKNN